MTSPTPKRLSINLPDELGYKLDMVCKAHNLNRTELIHQFINTQYELISENSQVRQTLSKIEELSKELEELSIQFKPTK